MTDTNNNRDTARDVFWRYSDTYYRGHDTYVAEAMRLDDVYLGGGRQWTAAARAKVEASGRPAREVNIVMPTVNDTAGLQIANRVDISYLPKGGRGDEKIAKVLSQTVKHTLDNTNYRYHETDMFIDGLIQRRGYVDIRMSYEDNTLGEVKITCPDPLDVIPDPDGKSYDPDDWGDVQLTRWMTLREIEGSYGEDAAKEVEGKSYGYCDVNFTGADRADRGGFGLPYSYSMGMGWYKDDRGERLYRVIDRQSNEYKLSLCAVWPTGDIRVVEGLPREHLAWLMDQGVAILKRRMRRVRWQVAAPEVAFVDKLSPYNHFTIVPFFPFFRRGKTVGQVDNMLSPQEMLNKMVSQFEHVVNSSANGGWQGEADSLSNMTDDEFTHAGSEVGLMLLRKAGKQPFQKIEPNQVPTGIDRMIDFATEHLGRVSGVDPQNSSVDRSDMSGIALQSLDYAQQRKLAVPLDNLSRTRKMVANRVVECVQKFMGNERIIRITELDEYGIEKQTPLALNSIQEDGSVLNDLTIGEYDAEVSERPASVTFNNSEFEQIKAMRKDMGMPIPDAVVIKASNLADKSAIAEQMKEAAGQADPLMEADVALKTAQKNLADATAVSKSIEAQFSAIQTATAIVTTPASAALADALLRSGGYVDKDAAPIVPEAPAGLPAPALDQPENTHPLYPANPDVGLTTGLHDGPAQP